MKTEYKLSETAVAHVPKESLASLKDDSGFTEHIVKQLSYELADRIMGILDREDEVIIKQSDLKVSEYMPTNSVEYRRQIEWSPLVRCRECKWYKTNYSWNGKEHHVCVIEVYEPVRKADDFCSRGERREDDESNV